MSARAARRQRAPEKRHGATGFLGKTTKPSRRAYVWVLANPKLWSSMTWHIKANSPRDLTVYARVYKLALQRSKATSLQLYEAVVLIRLQPDG